MENLQDFMAKHTPNDNMQRERYILLLKTRELEIKQNEQLLKRQKDISQQNNRNGTSSGSKKSLSVDNLVQSNINISEVVGEICLNNDISYNTMLKRKQQDCENLLVSNKRRLTSSTSSQDGHENYTTNSSSRKSLLQSEDHDDLVSEEENSRSRPLSRGDLVGMVRDFYGLHKTKSVNNNRRSNRNSSSTSSSRGLLVESFFSLMDVISAGVTKCSSNSSSSSGSSNSNEIHACVAKFQIHLKEILPDNSSPESISVLGTDSLANSQRSVTEAQGLAPITAPANAFSSLIPSALSSPDVTELSSVVPDLTTSVVDAAIPSNSTPKRKFDLNRIRPLTAIPVLGETTTAAATTAKTTKTDFLSQVEVAQSVATSQSTATPAKLEEDAANRPANISMSSFASWDVLPVKVTRSTAPPPVQTAPVVAKVSSTKEMLNRLKQQRLERSQALARGDPPPGTGKNDTQLSSALNDAASETGTTSSRVSSGSASSLKPPSFVTTASSPSLDHSSSFPAPLVIDLSRLPAAQLKTVEQPQSVPKKQNYVVLHTPRRVDIDEWNEETAPLVNNKPVEKVAEIRPVTSSSIHRSEEHLSSSSRPTGDSSRNSRDQHPERTHERGSAHRTGGSGGGSGDRRYGDNRLNNTYSSSSGRDAQYSRHHSSVTNSNSDRPHENSRSDSRDRNSNNSSNRFSQSNIRYAESSHYGPSSSGGDRRGGGGGGRSSDSNSNSNSNSNRLVSGSDRDATRNLPYVSAPSSSSSITSTHSNKAQSTVSTTGGIPSSSHNSEYDSQSVATNVPQPRRNTPAPQRAAVSEVVLATDSDSSDESPIKLTAAEQERRDKVSAKRAKEREKAQRMLDPEEIEKRRVAKQQSKDVYKMLAATGKRPPQQQGNRSSQTTLMQRPTGGGVGSGLSSHTRVSEETSSQTGSTTASHHSGTSSGGLSSGRR